MPRKAIKADKPALQFIERPVGGSKLQHAPEVRAAVNPKDFFPESLTHNSSDLNSWVSSVNPQFDCSSAAARPKRRGRRNGQKTSSLLDQCSQLSRQNNTCAVSKVKNQPRASVCPRKRNAEALPDGAASHSRRLDSSVCPPPDVDTPERMWEEVNCSSSSPRFLLFAQPCTSPCRGPPEALVADTPERDYGVKVTWRRRKGLMLMLKERELLSDSDALIHC
uniref:Uncharacterized protein n=1 Tax=Poecilia reticulata TaxID=8081 RepID=A0A3P9QFX7_POERE